MKIILPLIIMFSAHCLSGQELVEKYRSESEARSSAIRSMRGLNDKSMIKDDINNNGFSDIIVPLFIRDSMVVQVFDGSNMEEIITAGFSSMASINYRYTPTNDSLFCLYIIDPLGDGGSWMHRVRKDRENGGSFRPF